MEIVSAVQRQTKQGPSEWFSGDVTMEPIADVDSPLNIHAYRVTFEPGARTAWHAHPFGQVLHIESGTARIQAKGEPVQTANPGDTVHIAAGEVHWHGAGQDEPMIHLAMQITDAEGQDAMWFDKVSEEEYAQSPGYLG